MQLNRRRFLGGCAALGALGSGCDRETEGTPRRHGPQILHGASSEFLALPPGFEVTLIQQSGTPMSDGLPAPPLPDGMACFETPEGLVLLRNHELDAGRAAQPQYAFDRNMAGGVTRLLLDKKTLAVKDSRWVLTGTSRNCAGGPCPSGWLSCEESREEGHGWVFLCRTDATTIRRPERLPSLGRFRHEAAAFRAADRATFLTEDEADSALYKHVGGSDPFIGSLFALRVLGRPGLDLAQAASRQESLPIEWVPVADPLARRKRTAHQAFEQGAARVSRGEGAWVSEDGVYFVSTDGGPRGRGQIFCIKGKPGEEQLYLVAQSDELERFKMPDNITVAPDGTPYFVEDGDSPNRIFQIRRDGHVEQFGQNVWHGGHSELAGVCFSPDGGTLFVNVQSDGFTLAVRGPFQARPDGHG